jgi:hypothetical protein
MYEPEQNYSDDDADIEFEHFRQYYVLSNIKLSQAERILLNIHNDCEYLQYKTEPYYPADAIIAAYFLTRYRDFLQIKVFTKNETLPTVSDHIWLLHPFTYDGITCATQLFDGWGYYCIEAIKDYMKKYHSKKELLLFKKELPSTRHYMNEDSDDSMIQMISWC